MAAKLLLPALQPAGHKYHRHPDKKDLDGVIGHQCIRACAGIMI